MILTTDSAITSPSMQNLEKPAGPEPITTSDGRRIVILHYHYFKNAGTTFDAILKRTFPDRWVTREFTGPVSERAHGLKQWIEECPDAVCFSSHSAELPVPEIDRTCVLPVLFIRHPLDRIRSAYEFERRQVKSTYGSRLAKEKNLAEYIETRLGRDRQCRNFHAAKLARMYPATQGTELERALKALDALPVIGLVDRFEQSLQRISLKLLELGLESFSLRNIGPRNTSSGSPRPVEESLSALRSGLGPGLFARLEEVNEDDIKVLEKVRIRYDQGTVPEPSHFRSSCGSHALAPP